MHMGDNARMTLYAIVIVVLLGLAGYILFTNTIGDGGVAATSTPTTTVATTTNEVPSNEVTSVQIAVLDTSGATSTAKSRGCDRVVMQTFPINATNAPLSSAMQLLFGISTTSVNGYFNFIDRTNETLKFDRATVENGTANIYLTGSLTGLAGVCDDPRAQIQIEETALQFPTVQRVVIFLNNATSTLIQGER